MDYFGAQLANTNPGIASASSWGPECMDGELLSCKVDSDCVPLSPVDGRLQCYRGVCVMDMGQSPSCYSHRDCAGTDQMCSGDGQCADPVLQVSLPSQMSVHDACSLEFEPDPLTSAGRKTDQLKFPGLFARSLD
jgi:hypothetical protein